MFLNMVMRRNPALVEAAHALHQRGEIPSNSYVVDLDAVRENSRHMSEAAARAGLELFQMTKQVGRNPLIATAVASSGIAKAVAVDIDDTRVLAQHGIAFGNVGHLVQIPFAETSRVLSLHPEFFTVFNVVQARRAAGVASRTQTTQQLLLRVVGDDDYTYPGQEGGVPLPLIVEVAKAINQMDGVQIAGVTSFPCLLWDAELRAFQPTPNLSTLQRAAELLAAAGEKVSSINAPSATCTSTIGLLRSAGVTHGEPGSSLIGETPLHAVSPDEPEIPAMIYVTEVADAAGGVAQTLGGGFYVRSRAEEAVVLSGGRQRRAAVKALPSDVIDYYGSLHLPAGDPASVGDTAIYAFRSQAFVSRSFVSVLSGVQTDPRLLGIFDRNGNMLGEDLLPLGGNLAVGALKAVWTSLARS